METNDTIVAIATPLGEGGISVIRISGKNALPIASKLFHSSFDILKNRILTNFALILSGNLVWDKLKNP